jgi:hypothetical protein
MKNLITSAILFVGLTVSAQSPIEERYDVFDTIPDDGIDFVAKFEAAFVDMGNRTDTIIVYPFISYYEFDGFKIEGIWLAFLNKFEKLKNADFVFEKETIVLHTCKSQDQSKFDKKYIMSAKSKVKSDAFLTSLYAIKFNDKTYVPINNCDLYFTYMLGVIEGLKTNWLK